MQLEHNEILSRIKTQSESKKKVVFVSGNFNIVHPGHLRLLRFAAECGDYLVVGVNGQTNEDIFLPADLRLEGVRSISWVNHAFLLQDSPEKFIEALQPSIVVKGKEHEEKYNPELLALEEYGGTLLFNSGDLIFSSIDLLKKEFLESNLSTIKKPSDFPKRHGFSVPELGILLDKFKYLRVTVIGDLIVDEYINCDPLGMSQEDATIVVSPVLREKFIGGAAIVAAHARATGATVNFFGVSGVDDIAKFATQKLSEFGVNTFLFEDENRPTTLKQRFRANGKTLLRVSHLRQNDVTRETTRKIINSLKKRLLETDLLIFSDFNYGCLPQQLVDNIVNFCVQKNILMVGDSQSSSQVGDVSRFKEMLLLTPTEREARLAVRDFQSGLVVLAEALRKQSKGKNVVITLGSEGLLIHAATTHKNKWITDRLPAMNTSPKDTAGAGDSFLTYSSLALATGADIWQSTYLGSIAAACQVGRIGNSPLTPQEIRTEINI